MRSPRAFVGSGTTSTRGAMPSSPPWCGIGSSRGGQRSRSSRHRRGIRSRSNRPGFPTGSSGCGVDCTGRTVGCSLTTCGALMPAPRCRPTAPAASRATAAGTCRSPASPPIASGPTTTCCGRFPRGSSRRFQASDCGACSPSTVPSRSTRRRRRSPLGREGGPRPCPGQRPLPGTCNSTWSRRRSTWGCRSSTCTVVSGSAVRATARPGERSATSRSTVRCGAECS